MLSLLALAPLARGGELCSRPVDFAGLELRYQAAFEATDKDFIDTLSDYTCSRVDPNRPPCTEDAAGNFQGITIGHVEPERCRDRLLKTEEGGNVDHYVNCVKCNYLRCDCPEDHYLHFLEDGTCWPTKPKTGLHDGRVVPLSWPNIDRCGEWGECGYLCLKCPAGTNRFNTGPAFQDGKGANCVGVTCCTVDETGTAEKLDAIYGEGDDEIDEENEARTDFKTSIDDANNIISTPRWNDVWRRSEMESRVLRDTAGPELAKLVDAMYGRDVGICGATRADRTGVVCGSDVQIKQTPCFLSRAASTMTLAFIPYSNTIRSSLRRSIYQPLLEGEIGDRCLPCQTLVVAAGSTSSSYGAPRLTCIDRFFNTRLVDNWCTDCDKVEKIESLVADFTVSDIDAGTTGDKITTYTTECKSYDDGAGERTLLGMSEVGLGVVGWVAMKGTGTYDRLWEVHNTNERKCNEFLLHNPDHIPKTIACGDGVYHEGVEIKCHDRVLEDVPESYRVVPEPTYTRSRLEISDDVDVIPLTSQGIPENAKRYGLNTACMINNGTWSINACELLRRAREENFCYDFHDTVYGELGLSRTDIVDYFDNLRTVEAHDRRAFVFFVPNMPPGTFLETFTDTKCTDSKFLRSLHHYEKEFHLIELGMQYTETIDEDYMQMKWDAYDNSGENPRYKEVDDREDLPYIGGAPPIEFIVDELKKLENSRPAAQNNEKSFRIHVDHDYMCDCPTGQVLVPPNQGNAMDNHFFDRLGYMRCEECPNDGKRYIVVPIPFSGSYRLTCDVQLTQCEACPYGQFPNAERTACIDCTRVTINGVVTYALQDETTLEWSCAVCNTVGFYHKMKGAGEEFDTCAEIPIMRVIDGETANTITLDNFETGDMVVEDYSHPNVIRSIRPGHYLDVETRTEQPCVDNREFDARSVFRRGCGVNRILVRYLSNSQLEEFDLDLMRVSLGDREKPTGGEQTFEILREGDVADCIACDRYHYLSTPCSSAGGGFAGSCAQCSYCEEPEQKEKLASHLGIAVADLDTEKGINCGNSWLSHELETGCNLDGTALVVPESDYVEVTCLDTQIDEDGAFLLYGCGTVQSKDVWKCDSPNGYGYCEGWGALEADSSGVYKFEEPGPGVADPNAQNRRQAEANNPLENGGTDWKYVYSPYQRKVPYCPPKHFFHHSNYEETTFNPFHCALCTAVCVGGELSMESISTNAALCGGTLGECKAKAQNFEQCPGFGLEDTQKRCTTGCDIGYYEQMVQYPMYGIDFPASNFTRNGDSKCVPCETCRF